MEVLDQQRERRLGRAGLDAFGHLAQHPGGGARGRRMTTADAELVATVLADAGLAVQMDSVSPHCIQCNQWLHSEAHMASITIRKLDEKTKARLRVRAAQHGRSMEEEARTLLREALQDEVTPRSNLADAIRARFR